MPTVSQHYIRQHGHTGRAGAAGAAATTAPVVLMVSGGADSTALLLMACTGALDIQDGRGRARIARERLHVLHVNHHLRGAASDADEAFVRDLCERLGVPLCVEHAAAAVLEQGNLEAAAREVRYAAARRYVRDLCREAGVPRTAARIATAHTASDRAETFFMNAIRGSGPRGCRASRGAATSSCAPYWMPRMRTWCAIWRWPGSPGVRTRATVTPPTCATLYVTA